MVTDTSRTNGNAMEMGNSNQELVSTPGTFSKRKILIVIISGCLVLGLIILGLVLFSGTNVQQGMSAMFGTNTGLLLDEILNLRFTPNRFNGSFISDNEVLLKNTEGDIVVFDVFTKKTRVLLTVGEMPLLETAISYELSADRKFIMMAHTYQKSFRYSFIAHYEIINIATRRRFPLQGKDGSRLMMLTVWSPVGNGIAYVLHTDYNIHYKPTAEGPTFQVTSSGIPGVIYNGVPDWVNEEEVFSSNVAIWFSTDGKKLAYATFNDSQTRVMSIPYYGFPGNLDFQYSRAVNIRYPKPGSPNPIVELNVANLYDNEPPRYSFQVSPPKELGPATPILTAVTWVNDKQLSAVWMNRVQNESNILLCQADNSTCRTILPIKESKGWIDLFVAPHFSPDASKMVLILPQEQESGGRYRHVTLAEDNNDNEYHTSAITKGKFTVTEILHYDDTNKTVYFLGTVEGHSERLHMYEVSVETKEPKCISCSYRTSSDNKSCLYSKAVFSPGNHSTYYFTCLGPGIPDITIYNTKHEQLLVWDDNRDVHHYIQGKALPFTKRLEVEVPGGFKAQVVLFLPPDMDMSGETKYPMLVNVYGGPDSFQSTEKFNIDWSTYLTINKSIIYATIDGRGSGLKGTDMLFSNYRHLGTHEIFDQINVTRHLQETLPYIDKTKTGIWGWSYGGYATGMALAYDHQGVFKCGISVAPVTDWAYYDTIYTERYMGLPRPDDNLKGYSEAQLNDKVENLRNKQYYLIHGTLDDNVHYQQSMMLSKALEINDILFQQQSYPDEEHGLAGVRPHLYHSLEKFLNQCFKK